MTGNRKGRGLVRSCAVLAVGVVALSACDENGEFAFPTAQSGTETQQTLPANAPGQRVSEERDVQRPDIFEITGRALWDGRPSLGGVWVAHPDVQDPERVLIRNTENGETIVGALFRRERLNPGPAIQISSDAADALGVLAGSPVELYVVALRREEVQIVAAAAEENPVIASLDAPVNVEAAPLDPAPAETASEQAATAAGALAATVQTTESVADTATATANLTALATAAAAEAATQAASTAGAGDEETVDVSAVFAAPIVPASGPKAQIGIYSNERNANAAATQIQGAGIAAEVLTETMGGQTVWRVVAGPLVSEAALPTLKDLGYVDAFIIEETE